MCIHTYLSIYISLSLYIYIYIYKQINSCTGSVQATCRACGQHVSALTYQCARCSYVHERTRAFRTLVVYTMLACLQVARTDQPAWMRACVQTCASCMRTRQLRHDAWVDLMRHVCASPNSPCGIIIIIIISSRIITISIMIVMIIMAMFIIMSIVVIFIIIISSSSSGIACITTIIWVLVFLCLSLLLSTARRTRRPRRRNGHRLPSSPTPCLAASSPLSLNVQDKPLHSAAVITLQSPRAAVIL